MLSIMRVAGLSSSACWGSTFKDRPKVVAVPEVLGTWDRRYLLCRVLFLVLVAAQLPISRHPNTLGGNSGRACGLPQTSTQPARPQVGDCGCTPHVS